MENKKFCFIMCVNNDPYAQESLRYIKSLVVPEGYEIDIITVSEATSMAEGYNAAMKSSDAGIKIYLHQDVFIINRYFLDDILGIFESDESIGAIGMAGYRELSSDGVMWNSPEEMLGNVYDSGRGNSHIVADCEYRFDLERDSYVDAGVIDGLLIATNRDITWDEEVVKGFDFYDVTQSVRFIREGYRVVIPNQRIPWCIHDDNKPINMRHYEEARQRFVKKYEIKSYTASNPDCH